MAPDGVPSWNFYAVALISKNREKSIGRPGELFVEPFIKQLMIATAW